MEGRFQCQSQIGKYENVCEAMLRIKSEDAKNGVMTSLSEGRKICFILEKLEE